MEQLVFNENLKIVTKVDNAIEYLKMFEPPDGYYLAFSGGKDSIVCHELLVLSGVKFDAHFSLTTVDPPEVIKFIKEEYPNVIIEYPKTSMWKLIEEKLMPPTRIVRYCCQELKEEGGNGRFVITGVRRAESVKRSKRKKIEYDAYGSQSKKAIEERQIFLNSDNDEKRRMVENCVIKGKNILNIILDWEDNEVWNFIKSRNLKYPFLYDKGYKRIGCIGCPMQGKNGMERDFKDFPKYKQNYIKAFDRMLKNRDSKGLVTKRWKTGQEAFDWWVGQS